MMARVLISRPVHAITQWLLEMVMVVPSIRLREDISFAWGFITSAPNTGNLPPMLGKPVMLFRREDVHRWNSYSHTIGSFATWHNLLNCADKPEYNAYSAHRQCHEIAIYPADKLSLREGG